MAKIKLGDVHRKCMEVFEKYFYDYEYFGLRFENKDREIGEQCEWSKDNPDREDERDFPEYGTPEYDELPTLEGTSAWVFTKWTYPTFLNPELHGDVEKYFDTKHLYIVAGNEVGTHPNPDDGEILIKDAVVLEKLF